MLMTITAAEIANVLIAAAAFTYMEQSSSQFCIKTDVPIPSASLAEITAGGGT